MSTIKKNHCQQWTSLADDAFQRKPYHSIDQSRVVSVSTGIFIMISSEKIRFILRIIVFHLLSTDVSHSWNLTSLNISDDVLIWRFAIWRNRAFLAIPRWANSNNTLRVTLYNPCHTMYNIKYIIINSKLILIPFLFLSLRNFETAN